MLAKEGYEVIGVSRKGEGNVESVSIWWKPHRVDLKGVDVVVNLAGEPVDQRWTEERKKQLYDSRVGVTEDIVERMARLDPSERPSILLNSSAVGIYGDRRNEELDENSSRGSGFLADLCAAWERAADKAEPLGVRVVKYRTGVVLGEGGQAWEKLVKVFKAGIGGKLGDGQQWMPWIHVEDLRRGMLFSILEETIFGPVNGSAPYPERNVDLTKKLAAAVGRWVFLPVPGFVLKTVLGGFGGALLEGQKALPKKLSQKGFKFDYPTLEEALEDLTA